MNLRIIPLAALATFIIAGPASAATLLLSDNFDTAAMGPTAFNATGALTADQSGTAATRNYSINALNGWYGAFQRGNGGTFLMYAGTSGFGDTDMRASLNYDIAGAANGLSSALEIKFNMSVSNGFSAGDWTSFTVGSTQNPFVNEGTVGFGSLFRDNGGTEQWDGNTSIGSSATFTDGNLITLVFSDAAGTGSAFNSDGATDVVKMYVGATLTNTWTNLDLTAADQYISFHANSTVAQIDNLTITVIPESRATLLGGLGMLALLRRRRA